MKIESVTFENFIAIDVGLGMRKLHIDLSKCTNQIILLVGPMGSGKTTILSHLIPYSHVGTLDERNSNPIIISGENGRKEIVYTSDEDRYVIEHKYIWSKDHHAVKSYITKNGVELNENGNQNTFKEIVEDELGFTADLTRLLRLGPNVANVIDLPTIERKEYVAKMQTATEVFLCIYKDLKERARNLTSQSQLLARKLNGITDEDIDKMRSNIRIINHNIDKYDIMLKEANDELSATKAEISVYLNGKSVDAYESRMTFLTASIDALNNKIREQKYEVETLVNSYGSPEAITRELGKCEADINNNNQLIMALNRDSELYEKKRADLVSTLKTLVNDDYISKLQDEYNVYAANVQTLRDDTEGFVCEYNSEEINMILRQLQILDTDLGNLASENPDVVRTLLHGSCEMVGNARGQIEKLQGRIIKLKQEASNIKYMESYDVLEDLAIPKSCKDFSICPYYYTHPNTVKKSTSREDAVAQYVKINQEIAHINARIDEYVSYPAIHSQIEHCKKMFNEVAPKLKRIDALITTSIDSILTKMTARMWYDYDKIIDTLECCVKREKLAVNEVKMLELKSTIDKSITIDADKVRADYDEVIHHLEDNKATIFSIEEETGTIRMHQNKLDEAYQKLKNINATKEKTMSMESELQTSTKELSSMSDKFKIVNESRSKINNLENRASEAQSMVNSYRAELTAATIKLNTILDYQREYSSIMNELALYNLVIKASSPKDGIPLVYVESFLNDCVDDINDMLANVLPDLEINEFNINDKDFKISYIKNGYVIEDVITASQGERAIISIALSFALMLKNESKYNIPLLDEVDGPIHEVSRRSLLLIFSSYFKKINAEQAFFITHNDIFDGYPVDIISTTSSEHLVNKHGALIELS